MSRNRFIDAPNVEEDDQETLVDMQRDVTTHVALPSSRPVKRKLYEDSIVDEEDGQPIKKRSKNLVMLGTLKATMKKYPHCSNFSELVNNVRGTTQYDEICNIFLDNRAEKIWNLARDDVIPKNEMVDLMAIIQSLPDEMDNTITPEMTLALFNAWCIEQSINGTHLAWYLISRLQNRIYKKNRALLARRFQQWEDILEYYAF